MIGLNALNETSTASTLGSGWRIFVNGALFLFVIALITRYLLPRLLQMLSRSQELLVLFGIAWAVTLAVAGSYLGFSKEIGAFLAGVTLASTPFRDALGARLTSLRDFLLLFFFIDLGAQLDLGLLGAQLTESLVFSLFVLLGNPIIVMVIMGILGYRKRTGFLAGLTVAQISEFSLILGAVGLSLGHINHETMALITLVGLITISVSTYMIIYSQPLYKWLSPWLDIFERETPHRENKQNTNADSDRADVILFGLGRYGTGIAQALRSCGLYVMSIDYNPDLIRNGDSTGYPVLFGDAEDPQYVASLPLGRAKWVISTVREQQINQTLIHSLQVADFTGRIAVTANNMNDAEKLEEAGANLVLIPYADAAREVVGRILEKGIEA
jgi:hypothetical protein